MSKLKYLVIHNTATPEGRPVSSTEIRQWHLGPKKEKDGTLIYLGKSYAGISALPPDKIGGVSISLLTGRGWQRVGYRDMIHLNGAIENLAPYNDDSIVEPWERTNGMAGINHEAAHVVFVGGMTKDNKKPKDTRTPEQLQSLEKYVKHAIHITPDILISGHYQFDPKKACPCFDVPAWLESIGVPTKNIYKP